MVQSFIPEDKIMGFDMNSVAKYKTKFIIHYAVGLL